ncbi:MAG: 5-(carboxyamino)imidazole ribonucleotide synthase [Thiothrix sp.]|uniref:5-(carboxyamino)imidazole ribonucleotide synthase n=1 Tax=Thiothrix sp. TaxID=1032 RepID=UPI00260BFB51|nr:5-(carboxyamino)imidazole ribonucleotide synthase [Thiothrix sp.]MDD5391676.1 5-(carboxyamino)imidazole ribonucleotide synthase [Thiothrix sp.]
MTLLPGSTIGMLGGGQLGRMFTVAARTLGYRVIVLEPDQHSPAAQLADEHIIAAYDDEPALTLFGKQCDVVTTEFENIPAKTLEFLAQFCPVRPSARAVEMAQDRIVEKEFVLSCGLLPVPFAAIRTAVDIGAAAKELVTFPAILKTARFGYDGKGQATVHSVAESEAAFAQMGGVACVLEQRVELEREISVILARSIGGEVRCFPVAENEHRNGILHQTIVPARIDPKLAQSAQAAATRIATKLEFVGVMAVEFFVTKKGELLVNEMAPRTHNSGHYTLDACVTSQFEQQVRMICGLPFGDTRLLSPVVMVNLLGDVWHGTQPDWLSLLQSSNTKLHLYGKREARPGRKMGHYCTLAERVEEAATQAEQIFQALQ